MAKGQAAPGTTCPQGALFHGTDGPALPGPVRGVPLEQRGQVGQRRMSGAGADPEQGERGPDGHQAGGMII